MHIGVSFGEMKLKMCREEDLYVVKIIVEADSDQVTRARQLATPAL
jgi:hypothetical protein